MCMKALGPEKGSRPQSLPRCEPGRRHQATCLASADSSGPSTTLHDCAANPVHYRLGLVGTRPLGHVHGRDSRGASGSLFEFHWHPALPCLLLRHAHHLHASSSSCFLRPRIPLPLLWLQAARVRHFQCIKIQEVPATHLFHVFGHQSLGVTSFILGFFFFFFSGCRLLVSINSSASRGPCDAPVPRVQTPKPRCPTPRAHSPRKLARFQMPLPQAALNQSFSCLSPSHVP
jgi:hypothetical protein